MAKQRGLIQISGKLNDMCYFQRKGSTSGLIRRINTGMSDRVKIGEEYKNLRTANSFFGACLSYASITLNMISNRMQYMLKPNRLSLLAGSLFKLRDGKFGTPESGKAGFAPSDGELYSYIFDKVVKNTLFDKFADLKRFYSDISVTSTFTISINEIDLDEFCMRHRAVGCVFNIIGPFYIYPTHKSAVSGKYTFVEYGKVATRMQYVWVLDDSELEITIDPTTADDAVNFVIITVAPVSRFEGDRPITNYVGAACGLISILYNG